MVSAVVARLKGDLYISAMPVLVMAALNNDQSRAQALAEAFTACADHRNEVKTSLMSYNYATDRLERKVAERCVRPTI
jgi:hypothetical protein